MIYSIVDCRKSNFNMSDQLFQAFEASSKEDWLAKIAKELKGKPLTSLDWEIQDNWTISPFNRKDNSTNIFTANQLDNNWQISESIEVTDAKQANQQILVALMAGVEAPCFKVKSSITLEDLNILTKDIEFEYITTHFQLNSNPIDLIKTFVTLLESRQKNTSEIRAVFHIPASLKAEKYVQIFDYLHHHQLQQFRLAFKFSGYSNTSNTIQELTEIINGGKDILDISISTDMINQHLCLDISVGTSFFVAIAKIRALKVLWANLSKAFDGTPTLLPQIHVATAKEDYTEDQNYNMIRATTQALSAVIAGIDYLTVTPSDALTQKADAFSYRIARNVQHLLKHESHLQKVVDPAHGSYYVERLTHDLMEKVWIEIGKS